MREDAGFITTMREDVEVQSPATMVAPNAGARLRNRRQQLGLSIRDVHLSSTQIASELGNGHFVISVSRLSEIETRGAVPGIYRLHSLAAIYKVPLQELLSWYGVP